MVDLPTWVYPDDTSRGSADVGAWYYRGGSGIINTEPGYNEWYGTVSPAGFAGQQYAFLQMTGVFAQPFKVTSSGTYSLQWLEGGRPTSREVGIDPGLYDGNQTYRVIIDRVVAGKFQTVSDQNFTPRRIQVDLASGSHILYFQGRTTTGDHTAFIDDVSLTPAP